MEGRKSIEHSIEKSFKLLKIFKIPLKSGAQFKIYARISVRGYISFTLLILPGINMVIWVYSHRLDVQGLGMEDAEIMS